MYTSLFCSRSLSNLTATANPPGIATITMATTCPWQVTASTAASAQHPTSPTLQEIMDEELALRMQDEEWVQLAEVDHAVLDLCDSEDELEEKEPPPMSEKKDYDNNDDESYGLDTDTYPDFVEDGRAFTSLRESMRRQAKFEGHRGILSAKSRIDLGRNGSGAHESMFDELTQTVLRKLVHMNLVTAVKTRVQSTRDTNVFHGLGLERASEQERELALKIFKSSKGDFTKATKCDPTGRRYGMEYVRKSIQRHLKALAVREYKYLSRASAALAIGAATETGSKLALACRGVRVPKPFALRDHMLVTEFVGVDGRLAHSLVDESLNGAQLKSAYIDLLRAVRHLYQRARLVHGHLTASSILYHNGQCWIVDFDQAVDVGSEKYAEMLTQDLDNIELFFRSCGVPAATKRQVGLLGVDVARQYILTESPEQLLRRFPVLEPLLRD
ncbi:unnamed protein product [Phytophthora fragariaefolia]|uniref:non-specific serine/threonine protein kinase n=1 Tax=Phytophthora fragariaefolia TaxID=1490495 RepID=A0A9W6Y307_9STRA|nr:unnamed protein product [Phytophthora fragariaefolia]